MLTRFLSTTPHEQQIFLADGRHVDVAAHTTTTDSSTRLVASTRLDPSDFIVDGAYHVDHLVVGRLCCCGWYLALLTLAFPAVVVVLAATNATGRVVFRDPELRALALGPVCADVAVERACPPSPGLSADPWQGAAIAQLQASQRSSMASLDTGTYARIPIAIHVVSCRAPK